MPDQLGVCTCNWCGQVSALRKAVCTVWRFVPAPCHGSLVAGQIERLGKTGLSSREIGGTTNVAFFGTNRPASPGKYHRAPTNRSANSYTLHAKPLLCMLPTMKTRLGAVLIASPST